MCQNNIKLVITGTSHETQIYVNKVAADESLRERVIFTEHIDYVSEFLKKNEQVLFFINRRGYAPYLVCNKCGFKQICSNCSMYLTFHKTKNKAVCHHCSLERKINNKWENI